LTEGRGQPLVELNGLYTGHTVLIMCERICPGERSAVLNIMDLMAHKGLGEPS